MKHIKRLIFSSNMKNTIKKSKHFFKVLKESYSNKSSNLNTESPGLEVLSSIMKLATLWNKSF